MHRKQYFIIALTLIACLPLAVRAADKHGHDHGHASMHGGIIAEAGDLDYELVAKSDSLTLYVVDNGKPVATAGASGSVTIHASSDKTTVALVPAGENRLVAKGSFKTGIGVRVSVTVTLPGKPEAKLNFRLK